ncbi:MAG: hypothetical protein Tsb0020_31210 [Haliangiales bacterium]
MICALAQACVKQMVVEKRIFSLRGKRLSRAEVAGALDPGRPVANTAEMNNEVAAACPPSVSEYAVQTVRYVENALGVALGYDSDTLPVLDHYLRTVPVNESAALALVVATAGAYFGEVLRRELGGEWDLDDPEAVFWRLVLPSGIAVAPAGMVAAAIVQSDDLEELDPGLDVPPKLRSPVEGIMDRMSPVTEDEYYSLCGRFDTLSHVQSVLAGIEAERRKRRAASPDGN